MEYKLEKDVLTISLEGELNSVNSESVGEEIDKIIEGKAFKSLVLDFDNVSYISSAGLRIILKLKQRYDDFSVINASLEVYDVFQAIAEIPDIFDIEYIFKCGFRTSKVNLP